MLCHWSIPLFHRALPLVYTTIHNFLLKVSDTNDNDPYFTNANAGGSYQKSLNETVAPGTQVLTVSASDPDKGNNSKITYYISSNGTDGKFTIDMDTGVIRTSQTGYDLVNRLYEVYRKFSPLSNPDTFMFYLTNADTFMFYLTNPDTFMFY